jgi:hypothetical protein
MELPGSGDIQGGYKKNFPLQRALQEERESDARISIF